MSIDSLSSSLVLRISSFLDLDSCESLSQVSKKMRKIMLQRSNLEYLAESVVGNYAILNMNKHDPLWLTLGDQRVALLLGERHKDPHHKNLNTQVARTVCSSPTVFLTEDPPPATGQLALPKKFQKRVFRWENAELHKSIDEVVYPLILWKKEIKRVFQALKISSNFVSDLRIFARLLDSSQKHSSFERFKNNVLNIVGTPDRLFWFAQAKAYFEEAQFLIDQEIETIILKSNVQREMYLFKSIYEALNKGKRPVVVAGNGHLKFRKNEVTTLNRLNNHKIRYLCLIPLHNTAKKKHSIPSL